MTENLFRVEAVDVNDDDTTTLYCTNLATDEPFVQTFPPGATLTVRRLP